MEVTQLACAICYNIWKGLNILCFDNKQCDGAQVACKAHVELEEYKLVQEALNEPTQAADNQTSKLWKVPIPIPLGSQSQT